MPTSPLDNVVVVLVEPQDPINIGNTVRALKNMGVTRLRLVNPADFDPHRVSISAPRAEEIIESIEVFDDLGAALADCCLTAAMTARPRRARWPVAHPREAAPELLARAAEAPVALMFGREDSGLPNAALDHADLIVTIPTRPDYSSLNLGQAVLLMAYELFLVAGEPDPLPTPRRPSPLANAGQIDAAMGQIESTLWAIQFFKSGHSEGIMRTLRAIFHRADLDQREVRVIRGIFAEVLKYADLVSRGVVTPSKITLPPEQE